MDIEAEYSEYSSFVKEFAKSIDPDDQLPLRVSGYLLQQYEIHGEILDWLTNYLGRSCPTTMRMHLIQATIKEAMEKVKTSPAECGFDPQRNSYQPLKLVKIVVSIVNRMIIDLQNPDELHKVPLPPTSSHATELTKLTQPPKYSVDAIKNGRRTMEDKHSIIEDFNAIFNTQDTEPTSWYGIFDGHSGSDAASYANSHLNYNIAVHPKYPSDIENAMREAFRYTDISFLKKAHLENLNSGTTALCAMYRKTEKKLYVGWCGDSQALIARNGHVRQIVTKHSPEDASERARIEALGGVVLFWGNSYRVNGQLAVSRAIGDLVHKPYVSAEPEIESIHLDGEEDFIVLGCDGLWDNLTEDDIAIFVYKKIKENPDNYRTIATQLCSLAKGQGSRDNISVIVVFFKEPELIATQNWPLHVQPSKALENLNLNEEELDPIEFGALGNDHISLALNNINNNKFRDSPDDINLMMNEATSPQVAANTLVDNDGNNNSSDNLGPETDVDAVDEDSQANEAIGGGKEKIQLELKETEDVTDRSEVLDFSNDISTDSQESKILDSQKVEAFPDFSANVETFVDNKIVEELLQAESQHHFDDYAESAENFHSESTSKAVNNLAEGVADVINQVENSAQLIGESGEEESEDEWNYVQIDKKDGLAAVEETSEVVEAVRTEGNASMSQEKSGIENNPFIDTKTIEGSAELLKEAENPSENREKEKDLEDERHAQDDIEKDLQLSVVIDDFDDMSLNPQAKAFVPILPTRNSESLRSSISPTMNPMNHILSAFTAGDAIVAQSPRKGDQPMEDIQIPSEKDFDQEVESRPHETDLSPGFGNGFGSPDILNLKESLQTDDKLEHEYRDEAQAFFEEEKQQTGEAYKELESSFTEYSNGFQSIIDHPMNRSFYEGRDNGDIMASTGRTSDILNTVQQVPTFEDELPEALPNAAQPLVDLSDNFEAEAFIEEIKGASEKYIDQGLSPTTPEANKDAILAQQVELENHSKSDNTITTEEPPQVLKIENQSDPENLGAAGIENNGEAIPVRAAKAVASNVLPAKKTQLAQRKPDVKNSEIKAPATSKVNSIAARKLPASTATKSIGAKAPALAAPAPSKPAAIRKPMSSSTTTAVKPAPKPSSASAPATRTAIPPARKAASATLPKPAADPSKPTTKATGTIVKKPTTSLAAPKPLTRPTSALVSAKPKSANGTSTLERKPLTSATASTRVPSKPTSLAPAKGRAIGTSSLAAKPAAKPATVPSRLATSAAEKSPSQQVKEKPLSRPLGSATKSPRPATSATTPKSDIKNLKSPSSVTRPSSSTVGVKKLLPTSLKSPASTVTTTTKIIKKSPGVKKITTTTTVVQQKNIANGNLVKEEEIITQTSGDPQLAEELLKASNLSEHTNGNGLPENGAGDANIQMVLDTAAD